MYQSTIAAQAIKSLSGLFVVLAHQIWRLVNNDQGRFVCPK